MTPKQKARLKKLANYLAKLKPTQHRKFDMGSWFSVDVKKPVVDPKTGECDTACGTSACALGHAALIPEFQEAGLRLRMGYFDDPLEGKVVYRGLEGVSAAACFFGLSGDDAINLFGGNPSTAKKKARHIREVLKEY